MPTYLPAADNFGTQLAKQLGSSTGEGIANTPQLLMELLKGKRERQAQFGQGAIETAKRFGRELSPEDELEIFKEGADLERPNLSPVEMQKRLLGQAVKRENLMSRMEQNLDPERGWKKVTDIFTGESSEDRKSKGKKLDVQLKNSKLTKPQQRAFLSKKLAPEEVEEKLSPLSQETIESINVFPKFEHPRAKFGKAHPLEMPELNENQREFFRKSLADVFSKNPNANPLLLRKEFEKRGVNWREYRDALEDLEQQGLVDFTNNEDNASLQKYLYKPPLGPLKELLHGLKLIGR